MFTICIYTILYNIDMYRKKKEDIASEEPKSFRCPEGWVVKGSPVRLATPGLWAAYSENTTLGVS